MSLAVCVGALSVGCWAAGIVLYARMVELGMWAVIGAGLFFWLGAASSVMCLACCIAGLVKREQG